MTERNMRLEDWLDDLCVRFIMNLPLADLSSIERICFQVEEAQWFYEDFIRPLDPTLPSMSLRYFTQRIFAHCPLLSQFPQDEHMQAFEQFMLYKSRIPVRGAILLNKDMDSVLLVKGWKNSAGWSFPRGKINMAEDDLTCAVREVYEETGYNIEEAGLVPEDRNVKHIEVNMHGQQLRLYVFRDVPMETQFEPRTRKEISKIDWWALSELPAFRKKGKQERAPAHNPNKFYMVAPFLVPLRKWVIEQRKADKKRICSSQYLSAGDDLMTEEDPEAESAGPVTTGSRNAPDPNTLAAATAELSRLLHIQENHGGAQTEAFAAQEPPANNTGPALLALLQSRPDPSQQTSRNAPPHTPFDHPIPAPMPKTPQHQVPRHPPSSSMPPPPTFPIQPQDNAFSYQLPNHHNQRGTSNVEQRYKPQTSRPLQNPHIYQNQNLIHPQPLPPNVQKAVFTGGPVHSPTMPRPIQQQHVAQPKPNVPMVSNPQFPGLHTTMVPLAPKQSPAKLTSHSLALLNAFKTRDQDTSTSNEHPLRRYEQGVSESQRSQPQELPADLARAAPLQPNPLVPQVEATVSASPHLSQRAKPAMLPLKPITETQKSTLLDLFKTPTPRSVAAAPAFSATALPTSPMPSAVELSAVEPLSTNAATTSALLNNKRSPDQSVGNGVVPELHPEANLPFRAMKILARPAASSEKEALVRDRVAQQMPSKQNMRKQKPVESVYGPAAQSHEKQFQPQIMKRGQPESHFSNSSTPTQAAFPPMPVSAPAQRPVQGGDHKQSLLSLFGKSPSAISPVLAPMSKSSTTDGKQDSLSAMWNKSPLSSSPAPFAKPTPANVERANLLSLFGKSPFATSPMTDHSITAKPFAASMSRSSTNDGFTILSSVEGISARSRVGSLASGAGEVMSRRGSHTPISPADKGFLLNYLEEAVAKGTQH